MAKKIAILVRERQQEALRMAIGATLSNDKVNVFIMDDELGQDDDTKVNLQMLKDLKVKIYSNNPANQFEQKDRHEIALMLTGFDLVLPY